ncbi:MAG: glycosyltransferase family 2 protein [Patescibacteria group bacterium]
MRLAFITLHYKNLNDTSGLLASLRACLVPKSTDVSVYVVDNDGSPALAEVIKKDFPNVFLLSPGRNLGFAAGNNYGLKKAITDGNDILVCINNDTYVEKDFIKQIIESPIKEAGVGAVGGLIYFAPGFEFKKDYPKKDLGKVIWYAGGDFDWNNILGSNAHVDEVDHGQFKKVSDTAFVTGALLITRADVLSKVGLFDEKYFMYLEDVDLCHRLKLAGYSLLFDPKIKMWHKVAQSSGIGSSLNDYFITRNRLYFGMKYARPRTKFALLREALKKLLIGTPAQKHAIRDFFMGNIHPNIHPTGVLA